MGVGAQLWLRALSNTLDGCSAGRNGCDSHSGELQDTPIWQLPRWVHRNASLRLRRLAELLLYLQPADCTHILERVADLDGLDGRLLLALIVNILGLALALANNRHGWRTRSGFRRRRMLKQGTRHKHTQRLRCLDMLGGTAFVVF